MPQLYRGATTTPDPSAHPHTGTILINVSGSASPKPLRMWGPGQSHGHGVLSCWQDQGSRDHTWLQIPAGAVGQAHLGRGVDFVHVAQDRVVL